MIVSVQLRRCVLNRNSIAESIFLQVNYDFPFPRSVSIPSALLFENIWIHAFPKVICASQLVDYFVNFLSNLLKSVFPCLNMCNFFHKYRFIESFELWGILISWRSIFWSQNLLGKDSPGFMQRLETMR